MRTVRAFSTDRYPRSTYPEPSAYYPDPNGTMLCIRIMFGLVSVGFFAFGLMGLTTPGGAQLGLYGIAMAALMGFCVWGVNRRTRNPFEG